MGMTGATLLRLNARVLGATTFNGTPAREVQVTETSTLSHNGKPIQAHSYYDRLNGELLGTLVHPTFTITGQTVRERVVFVYVRYGEPVTVAMPAC
jgi:hypothetical protein